jgi:phosphoribulokinase
MSTKHPIISVTGSSGAGTSTVKKTFDQIFRREGISAVSIEGDAFHRFNRLEMRAELERRQAEGDQGFSHFSYEANELGELERVFRDYGETGKGRSRTYVHDAAEYEDRRAARRVHRLGAVSRWQRPVVLRRPARIGRQ